MEARDVFADEVILHGPARIEFAGAVGVGVADAGQVCKQGIRPDVADMALVESQRNAPVEGGTRDGQILQAALDERDDFVATRLGADEIGMGLVELEEAVLEFRKLEEPVLLARRHATHRTLAIRADERARIVGLQVAFGIVGFFMDAVPALVGALVEVAFLVEVVPERLHGARLAIGARAHEVGEGDIEHLPGVHEGRHHGIAPFLRGHAVLLGGFGDLLAVLVKTGDERDVMAVHALVAGNRVRGDGRVGRAQMRRSVHVVDRRGEGIGGLGHRGASFHRSD